MLVAQDCLLLLLTFPLSPIKMNVVVPVLEGKQNCRKKSNQLVILPCLIKMVVVEVLKDVYESESSFREALHRCDEILLRHIGVSASALLSRGVGPSAVVVHSLVLR
jgi:hypothetical protein